MSRNRHVTSAELATLRKLAREGKTYKELSAAMGRPVETLRDHANRLGISVTRGIPAKFGPHSEAHRAAISEGQRRARALREANEHPFKSLLNPRNTQ
jgi:hypothetical protein